MCAAVQVDKRDPAGALRGPGCRVGLCAGCVLAWCETGDEAAYLVKKGGKEYSGGKIVVVLAGLMAVDIVSVVGKLGGCLGATYGRM